MAAGFLVAATPSTDGTTLVLTLPKGSFVAGDAIEVSWSGLKNSAGQVRCLLPFLASGASLRKLRKAVHNDQ